MVEVPTLPGMEGAMNPLDESQLKSQEARKLFEAQHGEQPWMEDYWQLSAEGWPWRQAMYIVWASMPKDWRTPRTQAELANLLGLESDRVIRMWKADNPAIQVRVESLIKASLGKARAEIYEALIKAASNPSPRANSDRKLALELLGDYTPKQQLAVGGLETDPEEVDEADLAAQAQIPSGGGD